MGGLILRRLLTGLPTLLLVVALSFMLMRITPGGPFAGDRALDPATRAALASSYGLAQPPGAQFISFIDGLDPADFGLSYGFPHHTLPPLGAVWLPLLPTFR